MRTYAVALGLALALSLVLTPLVRRVALRLGAVSSPGGRNVHQIPTARWGGIAIALSALGPMAALFIVDSGVAVSVRQLGGLATGMLYGGALVCLTGAWDDLRGLKASTKLVAQFIAAMIAYVSGFHIDGILVPYYGPISLGILGLPVTVLWIVGLINAMNLIDGLDGLAAGVAACAAFTNFVVAVLSGGDTGAVFVAVLMASLMGALLGFLRYNFNPARIFMGDSGSYLLGFLLATSALMAPLQKASTAVSLLVPVVALGVPIVDTVFSVWRRGLERRPFFSPDRGHIHHRLLDLGVTHRRAVMGLYAVSVMLTAAALLLALGRDWSIGTAMFACSAGIGLLMRWWVGRLRSKKPGLTTPGA